MHESRKRNKDFFWQVVGPYCRRCGYKEFTNALQLHHIDSGQKSSKNDSLGYWLSLSRYNLVRRLSDVKFSIFCANCHIKLHAALRERNVKIKPIDTIVFKEMLKCMDRPNNQRYVDWDDIDDTDWKAMAKLDAQEEEREEEKNELITKRINSGCDCGYAECGFCGIIRLFDDELNYANTLPPSYYLDDEEPNTRTGGENE